MCFAHNNFASSDHCWQSRLALAQSLSQDHKKPNAGLRLDGDPWEALGSQASLVFRFDGHVARDVHVAQVAQIDLYTPFGCLPPRRIPSRAVEGWAWVEEEVVVALQSCLDPPWAVQRARA